MAKIEQREIAGFTDPAGNWISVGDTVFYADIVGNRTPVLQEVRVDRIFESNVNNLGDWFPRITVSYAVDWRTERYTQTLQSWDKFLKKVNEKEIQERSSPFA